MKTLIKLRGLSTVICLFLVFGLPLRVLTQNIVITDSTEYTAKPSAVLDVQSSEKGMLIPRLSTVQRTNIALPDTGLLVFDTNLKGFFYFNGDEWVSLPEASKNVTGSSLFEILNAAGDTVFAVYDDGVKITIPQNAKGNVGGFAVSGRTASKGITGDIFKVLANETRIYVSDTAKGVGGFAVSGRTPSKTSEDYLFVAPTTTKVFVNEPAKGVGGFAVSGRTVSKGVNEIIYSNIDSTRIYVSDQAKNSVGGFAVSGRTASKSGTKFLDLTPDNYFIGHESGKSITSGLYNSFYGYQTGYNDTSGSYNVFLGFKSGFSNSKGDNDVFLGYESGYSNTTGLSNVFIGTNSGYSNTSGSSNVFIGDNVGYNNDDGYRNVFIGWYSGYNNIGGSTQDGNFNVFIGSEAGRANTTGNRNVYLGQGAGKNSANGKENVVIGNNAGQDNNGMWNVFIGNASGTDNYSGDNNVYVGYRTGFTDTTGRNNTFVGSFAGEKITSGYLNSFYGSGSGQNTTSAFQNSFFGYDSGNSNTTGAFNSFFGNKAGQDNTTGTNNAFFGYESGYSNNSGHRNAAFGAGSGKFNDSGIENAILGAYAGRGNDGQTGYSENVFIGYMSGFTTLTGSSNVFVGYKSGYNEKGSNRLYIENSDVDSTQALIYGRFDNNWLRVNDSLGIGRSPLANPLEVEGDASKSSAGDWLANSDRRIKRDIQDISDALEIIGKLHPVKFRYTEDYRKMYPHIKNRTYYNFIAQEYREVFPESVKGSGEYLEGDSEEILQLDAYNAQVVSIQAIKDLMEQNKMYKKQLDDQQKMIDELNSRILKLEEHLNP